jgi:hypothetical protein
LAASISHVQGALRRTQQRIQDAISQVDIKIVHLKCDAGFVPDAFGFIKFDETLDPQLPVLQYGWGKESDARSCIGTKMKNIEGEQIFRTYGPYLAGSGQ